MGGRKKGTTNGMKDTNGDLGRGGTLNFERGTLNVEVGRLGPFFARAELHVLCSSYEGCAIAKRARFARGGGSGPYSYFQFFWDFVTGNRRKSLGSGVFLGGEGDSAQGERKGRLGKSYVDVACRDWVESLWSWKNEFDQNLRHCRELDWLKNKTRHPASWVACFRRECF